MFKTNSKKLGAILTKPLIEYETVQYWLEGLDEKTRKNYLGDLPKFLLEVGKEPDTIIHERKQDLESEDRKTRKRYEHIVKAWYQREYERVEKEGGSTHTPATWLKVVRSFFARNDYPLKFRRKELKLAYSPNRKVEIANEDLRAIWEFTEAHRDRALLLTLAQSGLSEIDVCGLDAKNFPIEELEKGLFYFEGYREKTKNFYQSCLGEDACIEIVRMLKARGNPNSGPLFVSVHGKALTPRVMRETLGPIAQLAEIKDFQVKLLRDFYHDALARAEITQRVIDRMMGHGLGGARGAYTISKHTIIKAYRKAWKYLTINSHERGDRDQNEAVVAMFDVITRLTKIMTSSLPKEEAKLYKDELEQIAVSMEFIEDKLPRKNA